MAGAGAFLHGAGAPIPDLSWHARLTRGRWTARRTGASVLTLLLAASLCLTAATGILMSGHAVPFLIASAGLDGIRRLHTAFSHWSFVPAAWHFGLHWPRFLAGLTDARLPPGPGLRLIILLILVRYALRLFLPVQYPDYMLFRAPFVFLDYDKPWHFVAMENALRFLVLVWLAALCRGLGIRFAGSCRNGVERNEAPRRDSAANPGAGPCFQPQTLRPPARG